MNKKRKIRGVHAALLAAGMVFALSGCSGKKDESVKQIQESGVFQVALVTADENDTTLENELSETIAQALGVTANYQMVSREEALQAVLDGQADIALGSLSSSVSQSENYLFSTPYEKGLFYAVTKKGDYTMTIGALANSSVGTASGVGEETKTKLSQAEGITLHAYQTAQEAAADLKKGSIRAYICHEEQARQFAEDSGLQVQNLLNLDAEEFVIVTGKEKQELANGINVLIRQFLEKES